MSEKKNQENRPTASNLFFNAFLESADTHIKGAEEANERGSSEVEETHVKKLLQNLDAISNLIDDPDFQYPRLSPSENGMLRRLESMEFVDQNPAEEELLKKLRKKAWGEKG